MTKPFALLSVSSLLVGCQLSDLTGGDGEVMAASEAQGALLPLDGAAKGTVFPWRDGDQQTKDLLSKLRRDGEAPVMNESMDLRECLHVALEYNRERPATLFQVQIAEAQHRQAMAGYFPHLIASGGSNLRSDDVSFVFPETQFNLPASQISVPAMSLAIPSTNFQTGPLNFVVPANSLGPGFPAADLNVPVGSQTIPVNGQNVDIASQTFDVPAQTFTIPEQEVAVWDRVTHTAMLDVKWLILDGGWRRSLRAQAKGGMQVATSDARRTDLDIIYDVTRYYKGAVLAAAAEREAKEVISRMDVTLKLTKDLYEGGSLKVTKLDYLKGKSSLDTFKIEFEKLIEARKLAGAALVHSMGLSWKSQIKPRDKNLKVQPVGDGLDQLIADTYRYSPDWKKVEAGMRVYEAQLKEQKSKMKPRLAFLGGAQATRNELEGGFANDSNLSSWNVGLGVEVPLFRGGLTRQRIAEARAKLGQFEEKKARIREKMAWGVQSLYVKIESLEQQVKKARAAEDSARESRELHDRAYKNDLAEAEDVFQAQAIEAMAIAARLRAEYDHAETRAKLDSVVGKDVMNVLGINTLYAKGNK